MDRLINAYEFSKAIIFPDKNIIQVGDNDSGRFVKLNPRFKKVNLNKAKKKYSKFSNVNKSNNFKDKIYLEEIHNDGIHQLHQADGLGIDKSNSYRNSIDSIIISLLAGKRKLHYDELIRKNIINRTYEDLFLKLMRFSRSNYF